MIGKWLLRLAILLLVITIAGGLYQRISENRNIQAFPARGTLVNIGSHKLHLFCQGMGSPTVILEAGLGNMVLSWSRVQPDLSKLTQVCSYDRAGLGHSEPGPFPRSASQIVNELDALIAASGLEPPFILVGHSNGALYNRLYERMRPTFVAGMVLVDPNPENTPGCPELTPLTRKIYGALVALSDIGVPRLLLPILFPLPANMTPEEGSEFSALRARGDFLRALLSETDETCQLVEEAHKSERPAPDLPITVLSANYESRPEIVALRKEWAQSVPSAKFQLVKDSGHWIQRDQPNAVIDAVSKIIKRVKASENYKMN